MTHWLEIGGGLVLLAVAVCLVILWQRVYYECTVQRYDTWALHATVHWCAGAFALRVRYDGGAGWWWECVAPFWRRGSYTDAREATATNHSATDDTDNTDGADSVPPRDCAGDMDDGDAAASAPARDEQEPADDTAAPAAADDSPSPSWRAYWDWIRYAIHVGLVGVIVRYIRRVQARMRPRSCELAARIGLGDAYTQGLLMGALYAAWTELAERITFVFTETVAQGRITIGGGVRPLALIGDTCRLLLAPALWKTLWYYWRHVRRQ